MADSDAQIEKLSAAIAGLEAQRTTLGDAVVDPAIAALRAQLTQVQTGTVRAVADERKLVTVVFTDISGFTALSEKLDPEKVRELINACFDWLVPVVQKYDGTIDKFIGDEIMALFGAPIAHEDDAERALRAGLEMMDAISARRREIHDLYFTRLSPLADENLLRLPVTPEGCSTNYHLFFIVLPDRDTRNGLLSHLKESGIRATFHYVPLHSSPMGRKFGYKESDLPLTEDLSARLLRLPFFNDITESEQSRVMDQITAFLK